MCGRMLTDHIHDARMGLFCVVKIGQSVGQARAEMQQRRGRSLGDPPVAVGRTGDHALEEAQHTAHALDAIEGRHKVHLGGAGVGKADLDLLVEQRAHQAFSTIHCSVSFGVIIIGLLVLSLFCGEFCQQCLLRDDDALSARPATRVAATRIHDPGR